jgi:L-amino acid N-acyltransferase YncA
MSLTHAVRRARKSDAAELAALLNGIVAAGGTTAIEEPLAIDTLDEWFISGPHVLFCFVAVDRASRGPVGFQSVYRDAELPERWADIATFVAATHRLIGVGTSLFARTRVEARHRGLSAINATIRADNRQGLAYYDSLGFRTYRTRAAVPLRDGSPAERIMQRFDLIQPI